ncbi:tat twin-arginine translocation pathway signal sequence domain protein [Asticcacaulis biprosthecium C19]|uniref:Tat twin-arginine translocation pathway signal sequence domain protein n=1 Tax=Asticcacaulis biprosthecium C19 TaxID=715226 RepID=F4QPC9_9CAUL|nr:hypothetical protein [Asticcacaulis biprosthecium]EGF91187.1 tat twin-arginine translocation pathway signal sequence domain protein [Asticcacaulis biprosthecium C19]
MNRRTFLATSAAAASVGPAFAQETAPQYTTGDAKWQAGYDKALAVLNKNVQVVPRYSKPVLIEGADYAGIWMECGPHEALVYRKFRPDVARNSHEVFFELQRMDGQIPCNNKVTETGFGQIQMVVPIAATAWELARATGDEALLAQAYSACSAWDAWLLRYRNTRGTGLTEGFCTYDTGHDNSPRWEGIPPQCPNKDAKAFVPGLGVPRLSPDLSATTYGARLALAEMARALGKTSDADRWTQSAVSIRQKILDQLYVAEDAAFYDLDANGKFVRVRGDILTRVCGERIPDQALFDTLWERQIHNPKAFWAPYPLPSIALDDPTFVRPIPKNSWGGPSQALTALRAPRWMDHYGRSAEFSGMMTKWCEAIIADMTFRQQIDPVDGTFTKQGDEPDYSPCALVLVDYSWRLAGLVEEADVLEWNVRPGHPASVGARFRLPLDGGGSAEMIYDDKGAELRLSGKRLGRVEGTVRLVTRKTGELVSLRGISEGVQKVALQIADKPFRKVKVPANQVISPI